jgi:hypothetical protein
MHSDIDSDHTKLKEGLVGLHTLTDYGIDLLRANGTVTGVLHGRDAYLHALYVSALAQAQGIISLANDKQYRVSENLARTLFEIWVNARLLYCSRTHVYAHHFILTSEKRRLAQVDARYNRNGSGAKILEKQKARVARRKQFIKRRYPKWPHYINKKMDPDGRSPLETDELRLIERCVVIDHYDYCYSRISPKSDTMQDHYRHLYSDLSEGSHATPMGVIRAFQVVDPDTYFVDIDGSHNPNRMQDTVKMSFIFLHEVTTCFIWCILKRKVLDAPPEAERYAESIGLVHSSRHDN